jgi:hypothetical protein
MAKKPEYDFDVTTPVESNRIVPPMEGECLCCGHVHRNKGASILRCWQQIKLRSGRRRACKCRIYNGLQPGDKTRVVGPFWGSSRGPSVHIWCYEPEHAYTAWTLCGREARTRKVVAGYQSWQTGYKCNTCTTHPLAARASDPWRCWTSVQPPRALSASPICSTLRALHRAREAFTEALQQKPSDPDKLGKLCVRYMTALSRVQETLHRLGEQTQKESKRWQAINARVPEEDA